jgi:hypothetical protein
MSDKNIQIHKGEMEEVNIRIVKSLQNNLHDFLETFKVDKGSEITHTIWTEKRNGRFYIPPTAIENFFKVYKFNLENDLPLGVIEQHRDISPIVIDLDFKQQTKDRRYDIDFVRKFIATYHSIITQYVKIDKDVKYFVLEKPEPRPSGNEWKDGLHIVCPDIITRPHIQYLVREKFLERWSEVFDKYNFYTNDKENVFDEAVIEKNGWFMYGSKKPNEEHAWTLSSVFTFCGEDMEQDDLHYEPTELVELMSIRNKYSDNELVDDKIAELEEYEFSIQKKITPELQKSKNTTRNMAKEDDFFIAQRLASILSPDRADNYDKWIQVGWCLRNIDYKLLDAWIEFSKKSPKFKEGECETKWEFMREGKLKIGTLHMWAKQDNPKQYDEVKCSDLKELIRISRSGTEYDVAMIISKMYDGLFAFEADVWYIFSNHKWNKTAGGLALRKLMPTEVANEIRRAAAQYAIQATKTEDTAEKERLDALVSDLQGVIKKLKKAPFQNSVLTECQMLFFIEDFFVNLDENKYLIGLQNGVYDLRLRQFREGQPDDMISLQRGHNYVEDDLEIQK